MSDINKISRDIFKAIHEGKWIAVEYRNKQQNVTKYWIGIKNINPYKKLLIVDGLNVATSEMKELNLYYDSIIDANLIEGSFCKINSKLLEDIEEHSSRYLFIFNNVTNLKLLDYYSECNKLDNTPYRNDYKLIDELDVDVIGEGDYNLSNEQFEHLVKVYNYNAKNNKYTIYTLPYLVSYYGTRITDSALAGDGSDFNNEKAVLYNMMLTKNINEKYGVKSLDGKEIIGEKYASIKFVENSQDFIVKTDDGKMGILASNGTTKIQPDYDEIKQIDKQQSLYLVKRNNKYGVISENGNIIIHLEYDQIGIDTTQFSEFSSQNIKKQYVLFEKCIPVQRDKKWGLYDKTGKQILPIEYEQLGCTSSTQNVTTSNSSVLTLHDYEAIIVYKDKKYGIIDATGKVLIPCVLDSVYSITAEGKESYYMVQGLNDAIDIERYFTQQGIKKKSQQEISIVDEVLNKTTNTVTNTAANSANNTATGTMNTINTTTNN